MNNYRIIYNRELAEFKKNVSGFKDLFSIEMETASLLIMRVVLLQVRLENDLLSIVNCFDGADEKVRGKNNKIVDLKKLRKTVCEIANEYGVKGLERQEDNPIFYACVGRNAIMHSEYVVQNDKNTVPHIRLLLQNGEIRDIESLFDEYQSNLIDSYKILDALNTELGLPEYGKLIFGEKYGRTD